MSSTPKAIVFIVVTTLGLLSLIGVLSMAVTLFYKTYADPAVLTAFIAITSGAIGSLSSLLVNTRQPTTNGQPSTTVATSSPVTLSTTTTPAPIAKPPEKPTT